MHHYKGSCPCGQTTLEVALPRVIKHYAPRKCDCDFCQERKLSYLSDPNGALTIASAQQLGEARQGSQQAVFLSCGSCSQIVGVVCSFGAEMKGAVNSSLLEQCEQLKAVVVVSPKELAASEKLERWPLVWFPVCINTPDH